MYGQKVIIVWSTITLIDVIILLGITETFGFEQKDVFYKHSFSIKKRLQQPQRKGACSAT